MLMRTPAREKPGLGERFRRVVERLRDRAISLTPASLTSAAAARRRTSDFVEEEPDDNNMDVAMAALIESIERPLATPARFPSLARVTTARHAPHIPIYERPPHFDIEPRHVEAEPRRSSYDEPADRPAQEDDLSELRKDLMSAISARLGSPDDHLATIRTLLRSVK
ncbi:MAG: hypothetical protein WA418_27790 [Bradyrhizobium sp.]